MPDAGAAPAVTFALFAFNQERFVREAVAGALAQDCAPMEIILSDDGSRDRTYAVMAEAAAGYGGPHRVVLRRSPRNRGLAAHINDVAAEATGAILVLAAGDDRSRPDRVARLAAAFAAGDVAAVYSSYRTVDGDGRGLGEVRVEPGPKSLAGVLLHGGGVGLGATYAYVREVFDEPWPLPATVRHEDRILPLRARLRGRVVALDAALVDYRVLPASLSNAGARAIFQPRHWDEVHATLAAARRAGSLGPLRGLAARAVAVYVQRAAALSAALSRRSGRAGRLAERVALAPVRALAVASEAVRESRPAGARPARAHPAASGRPAR